MPDLAKFHEEEAGEALAVTIGQIVVDAVAAASMGFFLAFGFVALMVLAP